MRFAAWIALAALLVVVVGELCPARADDLVSLSLSWPRRAGRERSFSFSSRPVFRETFSLPANYSGGCIGGGYSAWTPGAFYGQSPFAFNAPGGGTVPAIAAAPTAPGGYSFQSGVVAQVVAPQVAALPPASFQQTQQVLQNLQQQYGAPPPGGGALTADELSVQVLTLARAVEHLSATVKKHEEILHRLEAGKQLEH